MQQLVSQIHLKIIWMQVMSATLALITTSQILLPKVAPKKFAMEHKFMLLMELAQIALLIQDQMMIQQLAYRTHAQRLKSLLLQENVQIVKFTIELIRIN
jgi:hypothetical protein